MAHDIDAAEHKNVIRYWARAKRISPERHAANFIRQYREISSITSHFLMPRAASFNASSL